MRPYFAVGEEVILCSKAYPESNGEYVIDFIASPGDCVRCRITNFDMINQSSIHAYRLSGLKIIKPETGAEMFWAENCLRKKHDPCGESYSELIQSTKQLVNS